LTVEYENILSRVNLSVKDAFLKQKTLFRSLNQQKSKKCKNPTEIQHSGKTQLKSNKKTNQLGF
jgi:hypothetical protein